MDFLTYVFTEVSEKRLSRAQALDLLVQFHRGAGREPCDLHPLLHRNTSTLEELRFTSIFAGDESFLRDHVVKGARVLPGVAHLEMVRAAVVQATGAADAGLRLKNIVFARPVVAGDAPLMVHVALYPDENDEIDFEIYGEGGDEPPVYSRGRIAVDRSGSRAALDLDALRAQCVEARYSGAQCYAIFDRLGLCYGPTHRAIELLQRGRDANGRAQAFARIKLPAAGEATAESYVLHPSIMDAALQAAVGLVLDPTVLDGAKPTLPFALDVLEIFDAAPVREGYALVRRSEAAGDALQKLDIDIADSAGDVKVRLRGFAGRTLEDEIGRETGTVLLAPAWQRQSVSSVPAPQSLDHWVLIDSLLYKECGSILEHAFPPGNCLPLCHGETEIAARFTRQAARVLEATQRILSGKPTQPVLLQVALSGGETDRQVSLALAALLKTAHLENPNLVTQLLLLDEPPFAPLPDILRENRGLQSATLRYRRGEREVAMWKEIPAPGEPPMPWKTDGVYLITGGAGGLGRLLAGEIAARTQAATLVLTGRATLDATRRAALDAIASTGARVEYHAVEASDGAAVAALIAGIIDRHGRLNGVVHAAGVTRDSFILNKSTEELNEVLRPKVDGLIHLDAATRDVALDFFALFSSAAGAFGNVGQADYAAANAFMDQYARYRNHLVARGERRGRTVSINWPLWADGGMRVDPAVAERMRANSGLVPLATEAGMRAFYAALHSTEETVVVLEGEKRRLRATFLKPVEAVPPPVGVDADAPATDALASATEHYLRGLLAKTLKISRERIEPDAAFEHYGIDSILVMQMTSELEKSFGSLSKTLFFEYQTLRALSGYFLQAHRGRLTALLGGEPQRARGLPAPSETISPPAHRRTARERFRRSQAPEPARARPVDIAIIGVAGRYPKARDLAEYWENLRTGKDCIGEIPPDRWDHGRYFDPDKNKPGKTYGKWGGFLDGVDRFDPLFFNISPRDAAFIDPQARLFLECVYATLEDAGYTRESLRRLSRPGREGSVGVYVGVMYEEYQLYGAEEQARGRPITLGGSAASIANRVSYFCNFHGPSLALDTMCSSSLTALHLACESLRHGACDAAIAGGVNVSVHPNKYLLLAQGKYLSSKGRCESFGEGGEGYVPGEGVGAVLLKPLERAIADGDRIYGVIKGTSINHGGKTNGYSVPNPQAQAEVIARALEAADVDPRSVSYIEAHGTGTSLGDPIEIAGLTKAFAARTADKQFCAIGSVKSNIGHCESAAGVAGLTKVLLQLKHKQLAPSLHAEVLNPHIDFTSTPFIVQRTLSDWPRPRVEIDGETKEFPRRAGISSFGAGGSNAHVILEEYVDAAAHAAPPTRPALIVLSAKNEERLRAQAENLLDAIAARSLSDSDLADIAYTLQVGREAMESRLAFVATSIDEVKRKLTGYLAGEETIEAFYRGDIKRDREALALFAADEDLQRALDAWIAKDKHAKILELWVKGLRFDWERLYGEQKPRRIGLPTYPFARERHWVALSAAQDASPSIVSTSAAAPAQTGVGGANTVDLDPSRAGVPESAAVEPFDVMTFEEAWEEAPLSASSAFDAKHLVCFVSDREHRETIARVLHELNRATRVTFVSQADTSRVPDGDPYRIARDDAASYVETLARLRDTYGSVDAILYLWPLEDPVCARDITAIARLLQAIARTKLDCPRLLLAGHAHDGVDRAYLEAWIGFERSLPRALPHLRVATIFEMQGPQALGMKPWVERLVAELGTAGESVLYRDGRRHVCRVRPLSEPADKPVLRQGGIYLITGGFGGLAQSLAAHLAERFGAKLALIGRSPLDERKRERLASLEALGAQAIYLQADVHDRAALQNAIAEAEWCFGTIHGVIHAAGIDARQKLPEKDLHDFARVLAPKVQGTLLLDELLEGRPLDFVCYFSSSSAVLGDFGWCDYAIGNRFQMVYAEHRPAVAPGKAVAIAWPMWAHGGMGFEDEQAARLYFKSTGQRALETEEGLVLFERLLSHRGAHTLVIAGQRSRVERMLGVRAAIPVRADAAAGRGRRPPLAGLDAAQCLAWELRDMASELLQLPRERLGTEDNLADLGFESVSLAQLARRLSEHYGIDVLPSVFFSYPTLAALTAHLLDEHRETMEQFYREAAPVAPSAPVPEPTGPREIRPRPAPALAAPIAPHAGMDEAIAITGMSGRFPSARNIREFWQILADGREAVGEIPPDRFDWRKYFGTEAAPGGKRIVSKYLGALPGAAEFDPLFFEISPREAETMDPRQRLLLQEAWNALEDAGLGGPQLARHKIGMFVGVEQGDYQFLVRGNGSVTANHDAILAARLAYVLDLHGPTLAINTACSSGLVAAHQACLSLRAGECDAAVVAGVNLLLTPQSYIAMSDAGMLSPDGKCYAFDRRANGMVPGEAVVVLVLKRLAQAEADGDPIYATIRASGINYDGKTNGITAPSGIAQTRLLKEVYERSRINPRDIEYIVTHGTGTRLGDPVEINALCEAFKDHTQARRFCALTSTKTNFGHTFAASGLLSLVSLVQAMRHERIPPSLHCTEESDYVRWDESPFFVNKAARPWPSRAEGPRLGAVSAFGMSGTNAHMVLASYDRAPPCPASDALPGRFLLAVSAKTAAALREKIEALCALFRERTFDNAELRALSYTLLCARQHFAHRSAIVAADGSDAVRIWSEIGSNGKPSARYEGQVVRDFNPGKALVRAAEAVLDQSAPPQTDAAQYHENLCALADFYCQGYALAWERLFGSPFPARLHLPTYPFGRDRYWASATPSVAAAVAHAEPQRGKLHPLLHENISTLFETRFRSRFTGQEFFLNEHRVRGAAVLPAAVQLEMARAAVAVAVGDTTGRLQLRDVTFTRPAVAGADAPLVIDVVLSSQPDESVRFTICSGNGDACIVHSEGRALRLSSAVAGVVDIATLETQCVERELHAGECYDVLAQLGLHYGPSLQTLQRVQVGGDSTGGSLVIGRLRLPAPLAESDSYMLHPAMLDGALQTSVALAPERAPDDAGKPALPFAVEQANLYASLPKDAVAIARYSADSGSAASLRKFDVDIVDANGNICAEIRGFSVRAAAQASATETESAAPLVGALTLLPVWDATDRPDGETWPPARARVVIVGGSERQRAELRDRYSTARAVDVVTEDSAERIAQKLSGDAVEHLFWIVPASCVSASAGAPIIAEQEIGVRAGFRLIKALLALGYDANSLGFTVVTTQTQAIASTGDLYPAHAGVHGLIGSLAKEYPNWCVRLVDVAAEGEWPLAEILQLRADPRGDAALYRRGAWYRRRLLPCAPPAATGTAFRERGVYVVLGGAGGIGEAFSEYLIRRYQAQMIWIGRRGADDFGIAAKRARLAAIGPVPYYVAADATDAAALARACAEIKYYFGAIHGVVHATLVLEDRSLVRMDEATFQKSLDAKVLSAVRLAETFAQEPLDFALFFSSLQSFTKAAGQSNYAAGCTFVDAYAQALTLAWRCPVKIVNWGFWGSVGAVASEEYRVRMAQAGVGSIEPPEAMAVIEWLLTAPVRQAAFLKTTKPEPVRALGVSMEQEAGFAPELSPSLLDTLPVPRAVPAPARERDGAFEALLVRTLFAQLHALGLFAESAVDVARWKRAIGLPALYERWIEQSLRLLRDHGLLVGAPDSLRVVDPSPPAMDAMWTDWESYRSERGGDRSAHVALAQAALRALPDVLRGQRPASEVIFPDSSFALVEGVYRQNPIADYFNEILAERLIAYVDARLQRDPQARLRLIEIGAGTGGTSALLFERLQSRAAHIEEYCYTDVSRAFLLHAEKHYRERAPYLRTAMLDIERAPAEQTLEIGRYDVAIATNVLHTTADMRRTLRNAKMLLKGSGVLLVNEITATTAFTHLTFGLLPGWWRHDDVSLRVPGSPALAPATWRALLAEEGFLSIGFAASAAHDLGQQIIVAQSDGVLRRPRAAAPMHPIPEAAVSTSTRTAPVAEIERRPLSTVPDALLRTKATAYLQKLLSDTLKIPPQDIDPSESLEKYGLDSILVVQVSNTLRETFGNVTTTLLFEHGTVASLAEHFIGTQRDAFVRLLGLGSDSDAQTTAVSGDSERSSAIAPPVRTGWIAESRTHVTRTAPAPTRPSDIAIVGLSGRYPLAPTVDAFWQRLRAGESCIREIPPTRWDWRKYHGEEKGRFGIIYSKWGGFIDDAECFDPLFFGISPREAERMDPQERVFLQEAYACIADAGYTPANLCPSKQVGVYVGVMNATYQQPAYWSIANRVSALFDFRGPSLAVDTACSSSLTAIHLACESLRAGRSECALVGGVNLIVDPVHYMGLSAMTMLASGAQCRAFGAQADGFVDGEGVGAVLLKPLARAVADGDHIYGVIKGTSINHGGKTNGYTVPSPVAQADVIARAFAEAGTPARAISYVEAHGTGTALGDPIEIAGLSKAFALQTDDKQYCAIGSVKSNIGHLESAAGIAGLTKVLLQMKHRTLVPSLHADLLNSHIDFAATPFTVQRAPSEWKRPMLALNGDAREYPRIAGISSFGAGGSNAHVIIEEYVADAPERLVEATPSPAVLLLSAKNAERLKDQARYLLDALAGCTDAELPSIAYTLQVGREAMDHRLAFTAATLDEVRTKLGRFLAGETEAVYSGDAKRNKQALSLFESDDDAAALIETWVAKAKYAKLLEAWVQGFAFDWNRLYADGAPKRVSLPAYAFAKERYWIPGWQSQAKGVGPALDAAVLHPLLHRNTSTFEVERFSATFTGEEFFLAEHRVDGERVLPGVACLEMAHAAIRNALSTDGVRALRLEQVLWTRPVVVAGTSTTVHIELQQDEHGVIDYEIYTDSDGGPLAHAQGRARPLDGSAHTRLDLAELRRKSDASSPTADDCYAAYAARGLEYGPAFRALAALYRGEVAGASFVLARLQLPAALASSAPAYGMHPSLMDAALQASLALFDRGADAAHKARPYLPFALDVLDVIKPVPTDAWAILREDGAAAKGVRKLSVDICDDAGEVCVCFQGMSLRAVERGAHTVLLAPAWEKAANADIAVAAPAIHWIVGVPGEHTDTDTLYKAIAVQLPAVLPDARFVPLPRVHESIASALIEYAGAVMALLKETLAQRSAAPVSVQLLLPEDDGKASLLSALGGMFKSAELENPMLRSQLLHVTAADGAEAIVRRLQANMGQNGDIRYRGGEREIARWRELEVEGSAAPWKDGGVYLLTGGAGGLGWLFAREIARTAKDATLVLAGRSAPTETITQMLAALEAAGARAEYHVLDVTDAEATKQVVAQILARHGRLNGVLHAAGVLRDSFLIKKTDDELRSVLAPKVAGTIHLDDATRDLALDHFLLFSSMSAAFGNVGQADYACANAFLDAYAHYRNRLVARGERHGRTLALNWPLWEEGGMRLDAASAERLHRTTGAQPLPAAEGFAALYRAWSSEAAQVLVFHGVVERLRAQLQVREVAVREVPVTETRADSAVSDASLRDRTIAYLQRAVAGVLQLAPERLDPDALFDAYGVNSILALQITNAIERDLGSLSKTLFFEYPTIGELADHLMQAHGERLRAVLTPDAVSPPPVPEAPPPRSLDRIRRNTRRASAPLTTAPLDIAVIAMTGRYPKARDLDAFWQNLTSGLDGITEIPNERWDADAYFDPDKSAVGCTYSKWGGFIDGVDEFDPLFFAISPRDAALMDPQVRLFLMSVWELLERAGYTRAALQQRHRGRVGVYVGAMYQQYASFDADAARESIVAVSSYSAIANRVSYFFGFEGPSIAVDTMCSSALVAIHTACRDLIEGECEMAVAGGVNLSIHPKKYVGLSQMQLIGSHPGSRSFTDGDGYLPAEAVGTVLLKPLAAAERDGDRILAVIKATSTNHGGRSNGYASPNPNAQAELIANVLRKAGIDSRTISYVEAAANGSPLADALEIAALRKAFARHTADHGFCAIGSVKANIGHAEAASGMSQLAKVVLQLRHRALAPTISTPSNPDLSFEQTPFSLQREYAEWKRPVVTVDGQMREVPRRALINAFGAGGAYAAAIVEEYADPRPRTASMNDQTAPPQVMVFSAKNPERLRAVAQQILGHAEAHDAAIADIAYTLQVGREAMESRLAFVASSRAELIDGLRAYLAADGEPRAGSRRLYSGDAGISSASAQSSDRASIEMLVNERRLEEIARHWTAGATIPWERLHADRPVRTVELPTYPFARERYWLAAPAGEPERAPASSPGAALDEPTATGAATSVREAIVRFLSEALEIPADRIVPARAFLDYGASSVVLMRLLRHLQDLFEFDVPLRARELFEHRSIETLADAIAAKIETTPSSSPARGVEPRTAAWSLEQFKRGALSADEIKRMFEQGALL